QGRVGGRSCRGRLAARAPRRRRRGAGRAQPVRPRQGHVRLGELKAYPAIEVRTNSPEVALSWRDDFGPTAVDEERDGTVRIFFPSTAARDQALRALAPRFVASA